MLHFEENNPPGRSPRADGKVPAVFRLTETELSMPETEAALLCAASRSGKSENTTRHTGAARAGVVNLTKTLALEWSSIRDFKILCDGPEVFFGTRLFHNS